MLQHEQTDPPVSPTIPLPVPNAADARVTPNELNAALKALEDRQNSTVAIGSVVDELRLNATPEQIWEQVQKHREQQQAPKAAVFKPTNAPTRRRLRTWHDIKGWVWVLFWCSGGLGLLSGVLHRIQAPSAVMYLGTIIVSGDGQTETLPVQGKDVAITGDGDKIVLQGKARSVSIVGDKNTLRGDMPKVLNITGDGNDVQWKENEPHPVAPRPPSP